MLHSTSFCPFYIPVYGYGTVCVFVISISSQFGLCVIQWNGTPAYKYLISVMLGLAVGALVGDAVLHLAPHVSSCLTLISAQLSSACVCPPGLAVCPPGPAVCPPGSAVCPPGPAVEWDTSVQVPDLRDVRSGGRGIGGRRSSTSCTSCK